MLRLLILLLMVYTSCIEGRECGPQSFQCASGSCIAIEWRCDGGMDCEDQSDEQDCPKTTCTNAYFRCDNGNCIPDEWLCDGTAECQDNSDEKHELCANKTCDGIRCSGNDKCIPMSGKCDGIPDCPNNDDEKDCELKCTDSEFLCHDGEQCIDKTWVCNGHTECHDKSDEEDCKEAACGEGQFTCLSKECINDIWQCDGDKDCKDGSDENNCVPKELANQTCDPNMFQCSLPYNDNNCIAASWRCDGDFDCDDGSDEDNCTLTCPPESKMCENGLKCLRNEFWCDGEPECTDESDEKNCNYTVPPTGGCAANEFDCNYDGTVCIPGQSKCDGVKDCPNAEDEKHCPKSNACQVNNGGCQHICVPTLNGRNCECNTGYRRVNGTDCEDIDECQVYGTCSQICVNRKGTYKCECENGYFLSAERFCKANTDEHPELLFCDNADIRRYKLATYHYELLLDMEDLSGAVTLDYNLHTDMVYWAGSSSMGTSKGFMSANMKTKKVTKIESPKIDTPDGLAVDWVHGNLYITDTGHNHIVVFRLETEYSKIIVSSGLDEPRGIAVDPYHGWMYVTDWGSEPKIEKFSMDGKQSKVIVKDHIVWPNGITIDYVGQRLYWVDAKMHTIDSSDMNGGDHRHIMKGNRHLGHPFAVAVFEDFIYWTDWVDNAVLKANKFGNGNITTIAFDLKNPYDIQVYHPYKQRIIKNHCGNNNGGCSHLCLPIPQDETNEQNFKRHECACPDGMVLADSSNTQCVSGAGVVTPKPSRPGKEEGNPNRPQTSKVTEPTPTPKPTVPTTAEVVTQKPATEQQPATEQPSTAAPVKEQTTKESGKTIKYGTTEAPDDTSHKNDTLGGEEDSSPAEGHVAGIAVGVVLAIAFVAVIVVFILVKRYKKKNVKSMNFDNPVYRKTTDDQFIDRESNPRLERESMQPLNLDPEIV